MGEITDALRRAKVEKERGGSGGSPRGDSGNAQRARNWPSSAPDDGRASPPRPDARAADLHSDGNLAEAKIPRTKTGFWQPRAVLIEPPLLAAEAFRHFAVRVNRELDQRRRRSVLITSALPQEGKTTVSCNLALAIASMSGGGRTALVDLDLHRSSVRKAMGIEPKVGIERVLAGEAPLQAARIATDVPGFDIYAVAKPRREAHDLISGPHFHAAVDLLTHSYDRVVFDAPPVIPVPDVALAATHIATCIVVTRRGVTRRRSYRELLSIVPEEQFIGAFLNDARLSRRASRYAYYDHEPQDAEDTDSLG